jgi:hypothetical protein
MLHHLRDQRQPGYNYHQLCICISACFVLHPLLLPSPFATGQLKQIERLEFVLLLSLPW